MSKPGNIPYIKVNVELYIKVSEEAVCSHFGCGRKLSITDQLYNNKCIKHQDIEIETIY